MGMKGREEGRKEGRKRENFPRNFPSPIFRLSVNGYERERGRKERRKRRRAGKGIEFSKEFSVPNLTAQCEWVRKQERGRKEGREGGSEGRKRENFPRNFPFPILWLSVNGCEREREERRKKRRKGSQNFIYFLIPFHFLFFILFFDSTQFSNSVYFFLKKTNEFKFTPYSNY